MTPIGHLRRKRMMLSGMKVYSSRPDRIEKVTTWSSGALSAKASAIGTRNTIER